MECRRQLNKVSKLLSNADQPTLIVYSWNCTGIYCDMEAIYSKVICLTPNKYIPSFPFSFDSVCSFGTLWHYLWLLVSLE